MFVDTDDAVAGFDAPLRGVLAGPADPVGTLSNDDGGFNRFLEAEQVGDEAGTQSQLNRHDDHRGVVGGI